MDEIRKILTKARWDRRGKDRAYAAMAPESSSEDSTVSSDEEITEARMECESPLPQWIADIAATAHMTDQLHLFGGLLKKVGKKSVEVGGNARLRIEEAGQVQLQTKGGVMNLSNVLYVPDLGVNLLSSAASLRRVVEFVACGRVYGLWSTSWLVVDFMAGSQVGYALRRLFRCS
jgi:hypothetical protein